MFRRPAFFDENSSLDFFKKNISEISVNKCMKYDLIIHVLNDYLH